MVDFRSTSKALKDKIEKTWSKVHDGWKSFIKEFGDDIEKKNKFFSKWLPIITVMGIFLPLYIAFLSYILNVKEKRNNFWSGFLAESCLNLKQAKIFQTGVEEDPFQFNNLFNSNFYRSDWYNSIKELSRRRLDPRVLIITVNNMEAANSILLRNEFFPSDPLKEASKEVEKGFIALEVTSKMCNVITPHFIFEDDVNTE